MLILGGFAGGVRFGLRPVTICERLQFGYRFMNRMKPASDTNMPEGTVMDLRIACHLPLSVDGRDTDMRQISQTNGCEGAQNFETNK